MNKLYNKEILNSYSININGDYYRCYILDDENYYNIHIISDKFKKDEVNTLHLQEPKDCISINELDDKFMLQELLQFYL